MTLRELEGLLVVVQVTRPFTGLGIRLEASLEEAASRFPEGAHVRAELLNDQTVAHRTLAVIPQPEG